MTDIERFKDALVEYIARAYPEESDRLVTAERDGVGVQMWCEDGRDGVLMIGIYLEGHRVLSFPAAEMSVRDITEHVLNSGRTFVWFDGEFDRVLAQPDPRLFRAGSN